MRSQSHRQGPVIPYEDLGRLNTEVCRVIEVANAFTGLAQ